MRTELRLIYVFNDVKHKLKNQNLKMATCSKTKKGNLFEKSFRGNDDPLSGSIDKVCKDEDSYRRQYVSYTNSSPPKEINRQSLARSLEESVDRPQSASNGLFDGVASLFKNVLGAPASRRSSSRLGSTSLLRNSIPSKPIDSSSNDDVKGDVRRDARRDVRGEARTQQRKTSTKDLDDELWPVPKFEEDDLDVGEQDDVRDHIHLDEQERVGGGKKVKRPASKTRSRISTTRTRKVSRKKSKQVKKKSKAKIAPKRSIRKSVGNKPAA